MAATPKVYCADLLTHLQPCCCVAHNYKKSICQRCGRDKNAPAYSGDTNA